jgi:hypothetical protein
MEQLKQYWIQNTSAESQESISTDNSLLLYPVLWAPGPDAGLKLSTSLTLHYAVSKNTYDLPSLCRYHSRTATLHTV